MKIVFGCWMPVFDGTSRLLTEQGWRRSTAWLRGCLSWTRSSRSQVRGGPARMCAAMLRLLFWRIKVSKVLEQGNALYLLHGGFMKDWLPRLSHSQVITETNVNEGARTNSQIGPSRRARTQHTYSLLERRKTNTSDEHSGQATLL